MDRKRMNSMALHQQRQLDRQMLEDTLMGIPDSFFESLNFNPLNHWKEEETKTDKWGNQIDEAVDEIVDAYFKGFNTSTSSFSHILELFTNSQKLVMKLQSRLAESRRIFSSRNEALRELWFKNAVYGEVIQLLRKVEYVKSIPREMAVRVKAKQYLHAVHLLLHTLQLLMGEDLLEIQGLHVLRDELLAQKTKMQELLVSELHRFLYKKSSTRIDNDLTEADAQFFREFQNSSSTGRTSSMTNVTAQFRLSSSMFARDSVAGQQSIKNVQDDENRRKLHEKFSPFGNWSKRNLSDDTKTSDSPVEVAQLTPEEQMQKRREQFLAEEASEIFLVDPYRDHAKLMTFVVEALNILNYLPSTRQQIFSRVPGEIEKIVQMEKSALKDKWNTTYNAQGALNSSEGSEKLVKELVERVFATMTGVIKRTISVFGWISEALSVMAMSDSQSYSIESLWHVIQGELQKSISTFLVHEGADLHSGMTSPTKSLFNDPDKDEDVLSFSFSDNVTEDKPANGKAAVKKLEKFFDFSVQKGIDPSPYHITVLYRPTIEFLDQIRSMIGGFDDRGHVERFEPLREFVNGFISDEFLPQVDLDVRLRFENIMNDHQAFTVRELREVGNKFNYVEDSCLLLKCSVDVAEVFREIFASMLLLPRTVIEYLAVADHLLNSYLKKCKDKYDDIVQFSYAAMRLSDKKMLASMKSDRYYAVYRQKDGAENEKSCFNPQHMLYTDLYSADFVLQKDQLINESKSYSLLALLAESLNWLGEQIFEVTNPSISYQHKSVTSARNSRRGSMQDISEEKVPTSDRRSFLTRRTEETKITNSALDTIENDDGKAEFANVSSFEAKRFSMAESCQRMSDKCLLAIRMELHCHVFFFLREMELGSYWCVSEVNEPESFVLRLNKMLTRVEDVVAKVLDKVQIEYLFGGMPELMHSIFINALKHLRLRKVNGMGVNKISRNLLALQQNLTNIIIDKEGYFDRAQRYFDLLKLSEEELNVVQAEDNELRVVNGDEAVMDTFTDAEYAAVWRTETEHRRPKE